MERCLYWYIRSLRILTNTYTTALTNKQVEKKTLATEDRNKIPRAEKTFLDFLEMVYDRTDDVDKYL